MTHDLSGRQKASQTKPLPAGPRLGAACSLRDPYLVLMAALVAQARANGDPPPAAAARVARPGIPVHGPGVPRALARLAGLHGGAALAAMLSAPLGETPPASYMGVTEAGDPNGSTPRAAPHDSLRRPRAA